MRTRLGSDVHAPAAARTFVTSALAEHHAALSRRDDVVLVVSELVTNSVHAGASAIDVDLGVLGDSIELQVSDDAPGWPRLHHADPGDLDGRGLQIVGELADEWHTTRLAPGKRVTVTWSRSS